MPDYVDLIGLTPDEIENLLADLRQQNEGAVPVDGCRRRHTRQQYNGRCIRVVLQHTGGGQQKVAMISRNISPSCISLLHGGYLNTGTMCVLQLPRPDGDAAVVLGQVRACRYLCKRIHEVGIEFLDPVDLEGVVDPQESATEATQAGPSLEGTLLCISESAAERDHIETTMTDRGLVVMTAHCLGAGLDAIRRSRKPFGIVAINLHPADESSIDCIESIRRIGYAGPIIGLTWDSNDATLRSLPTAGDLSLLSLPCADDEFIDVAHRAITRSMAA